MPAITRILALFIVIFIFHDNHTIVYGFMSCILKHLICSKMTRRDFSRYEAKVLYANLAMRLTSYITYRLDDTIFELL